MIKKNSEFREERRCIGGGNGELLLRHGLDKDESFGKSRICAEITLLPGESVGEHTHDIEAEIYYMLRGELISIAEDGTEENFCAGDVMITGGGASHSVRNDSQQPATMLAIVMV